MSRLGWLLSLSGFGLVASASASTMVYTDPSAFAAAAGALTPITFSTVYNQNVGTSYLVGNATFDVNGGCANVVGGCLPPATLDLISGSSGPTDTGGYSETALFSNTYSPAELNMTFAVPAYTIGIYFGDAPGYNGTGASITLSDSTVYNFTAGQHMFFGAVSDTGLTSLDIAAPHDFGLAVVEVDWGTPEPDTTGLALGGLLIMAGVLHRAGGITRG